jgi:O-methyltransferase involved in polyketide biosynthesis
VTVDRVRPPDPKATYLATLYGKAVDAAAPHPILGDTLAAGAVARLDVDWTALRLPSGFDVTLPLRALHFDRWTRAFLAAHPTATVLHLGCGLDTRVDRIDPGPTVRWRDVDRPEVLDLRTRLYPPRPGDYATIAASVTDLRWLDDVPGDRPVLVVGEGLFMYLPEPEGLALLRRVTSRFPSGEIVFDAYAARMVRLVSRLATVRGARVELVWGIDDPRALEAAVPGLRLVEDVPFLAMPELVERLGRTRLQRALHAVLGRAGWYRRLVRHVRYAF